MLILGQEGDIILNFNNVSYLWIDESLEGYEIKAYMAYHAISLGEYSSYGRAMVILDSIERKYRDCNLFGSGFIKNDIYYMPEE